MAQEVRSLILERLQIFLHENTRAITLVPLSWLNIEGNFVVRIFGKVMVTRSLNFAGAKSFKTIKASAVASREGNGVILLRLAYSTKVDMYEVATSLCRLLFKKYRVNDALLFMTILSTDLRELQRQGYNGDQAFPLPFSTLPTQSTNSRPYPKATESRE